MMIWCPSDRLSNDAYKCFFFFLHVLIQQLCAIWTALWSTLGFLSELNPNSPSHALTSKNNPFVPFVSKHIHRVFTHDTDAKAALQLTLHRTNLTALKNQTEKRKLNDCLRSDWTVLTAGHCHIAGDDFSVRVQPPPLSTTPSPASFLQALCLLIGCWRQIKWHFNKLLLRNEAKRRKPPADKCPTSTAQTVRFSVCVHVLAACNYKDWLSLLVWRLYSV